MRRYNVVSVILLILSIIDFTLAAPVLVQEKRRACVDVVHIPRDVITVLGKRGNEQLEKLLEEYFKAMGKPVESSDAHVSSSQSLPRPGHGSTNVVHWQAPARNPALSTANPIVLGTSALPPKKRPWTIPVGPGQPDYRILEDPPPKRPELGKAPDLGSPTESDTETESYSDLEWHDHRIYDPDPVSVVNPLFTSPAHEDVTPFALWTEPTHEDVTPFTVSTKPVHKVVTPFISLTKPAHKVVTPFTLLTKPTYQDVTPFTLSAEPAHEGITPFTLSAEPAHEAVTPFTLSTEPTHEDVTPFTVSTRPAHEVVTPASPNPGWPPHFANKVVNRPPPSPDLELHLGHQSLSTDSQPIGLQAAIYAAKGKAKESHRISGPTRDIGNAA